MCLFSIDLYCGCLFYALDYNSILLNFVAQIISVLAIGSSFNWLLHPFNVPHQFFFFLEYFLTFYSHKMLQFHLAYSCPVLESAISPRNSGFFYQRIYQEPKPECQVCFLILEHHYFQALTADRARKYINVYLTCVYIRKYF